MITAQLCLHFIFIYLYGNIICLKGFTFHTIFNSQELLQREKEANSFKEWADQEDKVTRCSVYLHL